jgi:hypothetical protein
VSVRRYPSALASERAIAGATVALIGLLLLGVIAFMWLADPNPPTSGPVIFTTFALVLIGLGAGVARHKRQTLVVDLGARQAEVRSRNGTGWSVPLDTVGPLAVVRVTRLFPNSRWKVRTEYRVELAGASDWGVYQSWSFPRARRMAERLAREWSVGIKQLDGRVRGARELDTPLWRLSSLLAQHPFRPGAAAPLGSTSGVIVAVDRDRASFQSTRLGTLETAPNILLLMWTGMAGLAMSELPVQVDIETNVLARAGYWALGVVAVVFGGSFLYQTVQWLLPARVAIARDGVSYRGRTIALADVREVVSAPTVVIVGAGIRALELEPGFSTPDTCQELADEIRRLIVEQGSRLG